MDQAFLYLILWAGVFGVVFALLIKKGWILKGLGFGSGSKSALDKVFVSRKWKEVEELMNQGKPSASKVAIMEADKLVDYVLRAKFGSGDGNMAERIKKSQKSFTSYSDYDNLWKAHKARNRMAHEADHEFLAGEAKVTISYFKKALQVLKAL